MTHLQNQSLKTLAQKTVIELEPRIRQLTSPRAQEHFHLIKRRAKSLVAILKDRDDRRQGLPPPTHSISQKGLLGFFIILAALMAGFFYPTMGWSQSLFESIITVSNRLDRIGALIQRVNTQVQRFGLSVLSGDPSLTKYTNATTFINYITNISVSVAFPQDLLESSRPAKIFVDQLMAYDICSIQEMLAIHDFATLCDTSQKEGLVKIGDPIPFPDVLNEGDQGRPIIGLGTLATLTKNRILDVIQLIQTDLFHARRPSTVRAYLRSCLAASNLLYVWSHFRNMMVVG